LCASTIDHLATYIFLNRTREKPTIQLIRQHISSDPDSLNQIMASLFNTLLFSAQSNQWAITRPILSLLLAAESTYTNYQAQLTSTQSPENQEKLRDEFEKLTTDIQQSVESTNRDKFTQKLTVFRLNVRQFLTL
jgi:exportin-7